MSLKKRISDATNDLATQAVDRIVLNNLQKGPALPHHRPQLGLSERRSLIAYFLMTRVQRWQIDGDLSVRLTQGARENLVEHGLDMKDVAAEWFWDLEALKDNLDFAHVLELCDSHDIGETLPGDLPMSDVDNLKNRLRRMIHKKVERDFAESVLLPLLDPSGRLRQNYMEYEDRGRKMDKREEHLVKAIDCYVALRKALVFLYVPSEYSESERPVVLKKIQESWSVAMGHLGLFLEVIGNSDINKYLLEGKFKQVFDEYQAKWSELVWPY